MDIRYEMITPEQAREFEGFLLPYVLEDRDFDSFWFYVAIAEERIVGLLAESGTRAYPEILSIGVSPKYKKKGVGKGLLSYAVNEMRQRVYEEEKQFENAISARLIAPPERIDILRKMFEDMDFTVSEESSFYVIPMSMLDVNPVIQHERTIKKVEKLRSEKKILSFKEVSHTSLKQFIGEMTEEGLLDIPDISVIDENLSFFVSDDMGIYGAILFKKAEDDLIQNLLLYTDEERSSMLTAGYLLTAAATAAMAVCPVHTELMFWIGYENTEKMINEIFPEAEPTTIVLDMEHEL